MEKWLTTEEDSMDGRIRILVIDDEPDLVEMVSYNLQRNGYETTSALDGLDAWNRIESWIPPHRCRCEDRRSNGIVLDRVVDNSL